MFVKLICNDCKNLLVKAKEIYGYDINDNFLVCPNCGKEYKDIKENF